MKKNNLFQDTLEREIQDLLAPYPDPMGRTDFRKACRIGTRTSIYLLQSGLVPCENPAQRLVQELPGPQAPGLQLKRRARPHRRRPPADSPLVRAAAGPPA